jgi:hypothetical protein
VILREKRIIFVHIPKTGGTSVEDAIFPAGPERDPHEHLYGEPNPHQSGHLQHLKATQIRNVVTPEVYDACFRFSFIRNPWDKAASQYFYHHRRRDLQELLGIEDRNLFRRLLGKRRMVPFQVYLESIRTGPLHVQWEDQYKFICDENGGSMVDFVGRFERLAEDFDEVCRRAGLEPRRLPHKKKSKHRHYTEYYDDETRKIVAEFYARDIEKFGYRFGD